MVGWEVGIGILGAFFLHEGAHLLCIYAFGGRLKRLFLGLTGAEIRTEQGGMGYGGEILSLLAGPGSNLLCAMILARMGEKWYLVSGVHVALGLFNLLPFPGLDGGGILKLLYLMWAK